MNSYCQSCGNFYPKDELISELLERRGNISTYYFCVECGEEVTESGEIDFDFELELSEGEDRLAELTNEIRSIETKMEELKITYKESWGVDYESFNTG